MYKMNFTELDDGTRRSMITEFEADESSGHPYRSRLLTQLGREQFAQCMRNAIFYGDETSLMSALSNRIYWNPVDSARRRIQPDVAAQRLAYTEFNTWYVRGLAQKLVQEGETECRVYRAAPAMYFERSNCTCLEGTMVSLSAILHGHRVPYWNTSNGREVVSIPSGANCHHSICRIGDPSFVSKG